jgi:hypothetical protein
MTRFRNLMTTMALLLAASAYAQPSLTAPDVVFSTGGTGLVDISVSNAPAGDNITGVDLFLRYDSDVANATDVVANGTATDGWNLAYNIVEDVAAGNIDEIRISMANGSPLAVPGSGTLIQIAFSVVSASAPTNTPLTFTLSELNETSVTATAGSIAIGGSTSQVSLSSSVAVGGVVTVTVEDADLAGGGPITATVTNTDNTDSETVILTEQGAGVFEGTIVTLYGTAASSNSKLDVQAGDDVTASFDDPFNASGVPQTITTTPGDMNITGGSTATIGFTPSDVDPGEVLTITVIDADQAGLGPLAATISNDDNSDTETVTLVEQGAGVFEGTITTAFGTAASSSNNELDVKAGDDVSASFDDPYSSTGGPLTVGTTPGGLTINGRVTATIALSPPGIDPGEGITITVTDAGLAGQGPLTATISNDDNFDTETVTLTEQGAGVFEGTITTVFGTAASSSNSKLDVQAGDDVSASFEDLFDVDGGPQTIGTTPGSLTIGGGTTATMSLGPTTLSPGDDITVSVVDLDEIGQGPLTATITSSTGDTKTVTLTEAPSPPAAAGTFIGTITTVFATGGSPSSPLFGIAPGATITAEYLDNFNAEGGSETINPPPGNDLTITGGNDGTLTASDGVQAGGTLRIQVADPDLNDNAGVAETVLVTVRNLDVAGEIESVTLTETGTNTGIFQIAGGLATSTSSTPGDGVLQVSPQDDIEVEYVDVLTNSGATATLIENVYGALWGDTSGNGTVRALDAGLILQENVGAVTFSAYQTLVGDVSEPGVGGIPLNGFDAVLILRYVVGLETSFPDVESGNPVHPYKRAATGRRLALGEPELIDGRVQLSLLVSEAEDLVAGNLILGFDPAQIRIAGVTGSELTGAFEVASNVVDGKLRIAFAGTESRGTGQGSILHITIEPLADVALTSALRIDSASLNGGLSPVEVVSSPAALSLPKAFGLSQNWPNPFNPETQISYSLSQASQVTLTIYDVAGQTVATLVQDHQASGDYTIRWNARNDAGQSVASGIYFYRLDAGSITMTRKMSLLR